MTVKAQETVSPKKTGTNLALIISLSVVGGVLVLGGGAAAATVIILRKKKNGGDN